MNLNEAYKMIMESKDLQNKFVEAAKNNNLEDFLKEQNVDATLDELKEYITKKFTDENGELSKEELDMAAGGMKDVAKVFISIFSLFVACGVSQAQHASECFLNK